MITIVIPCFNEVNRINTVEFQSFVEANEKVSLLFVDDGSTDETLKVINSIEKACGGQITHIHLSKNCGKAEAVRQGMLHSLNFPGKYIGYWDADLATPLSEVFNFSQVLETDQKIKMVCGARIQRLGANIKRHWYRHYPGRMIATCISMMLRLRVYDTQCGAKLIDRELVNDLFTEPFLSPWLFDVELIARLMILVGRQNIAKVLYELPLNSWHDVGESKITCSYLLKVPLELGRIYWHYRRQLTSACP